MKKSSNLRKKKKIKRKVDMNSVIAKLLTLLKWLSIEHAVVKIVKEVCELIIKLNY